jgi:hypothetical protein
MQSSLSKPNRLSIKGVLRLAYFPLLVVALLRDTRSPFYHVFTDLAGPAAEREDVVMRLAAGKRVLHFGFLDAPFTAKKVSSRSLLHMRIGSVAQYLFGVDINESSMQTYRNLTRDVNNTVMDIQLPIPEERLELLAQNFDVIVFGEILEHLLNPGIALTNLLTMSRLNGNCEVCITTPNALYVGSFLPALFGREIVHPEHYYYYSPQTLSRLLADTGFADIRLAFYSDRNTLATPGLTKAGLIALCRAA